MAFYIDPTDEYTPQPFGPETIQIVDTSQGGAIAYMHPSNLEVLTRAIKANQINTNQLKE